ncbi:MAG: cytochrome c [Candidatus Limnocylindria bacterium]
MRMKALGVMLMVGFAAFTTFYWITDAPRREDFEATRDEKLLAFGRIVFLPDDTYTIDVDISLDGFAQDIDNEAAPLEAIELFVNTSISFKNSAGAHITVTGVGTTPFQVDIEDDRTSPVKFDEEGETTVSAAGVDGQLVISAIPPHLQPYGANCARCHGVDGMGGTLADGTPVPNLHSLPLAQKWAQTGGAQSLNNYVAWVITLGGVVRSGNISSPMPAWGQEFGGPLTRQQIEALTAMIGEWAAETLANPPPEELPDTVEAGAEVYVVAGCGGCHGADLAGVDGIFPSLLAVGTRLSDNLPTPVSQEAQRQEDYATDARRFFELWIRDSSANYNDGNSTGMPPHPETALTESQLQALITFLLDQTE